MNYAYINNPTLTDQNEELKSIYNKWRQRQFGKRLPIHIFGSGSEGNSVYLKPYKTLIDLGLPFKRYIEYDPLFFHDVDYIMLTHHHGDHINASTLLRILDNYPHIKIILPEFMWDIINTQTFRPEYERRKKGDVVPIGHDKTFRTDVEGKRILKPHKWGPKYQEHFSKFQFAENAMLKTHKGKQFLFEPLTVKHGDIINMSVQINDPELDFNFLYASDLDNLGGNRSFTDYLGRTQFVTGLDQERIYTCMFLEANYDENILNEYLGNLNPNDPEYRGKKARADGNLRHISEQEASVYIEKHLSDKGIFVPLHASKTFGTLHQT